MKPDWSPLEKELALWRRDGLHLALWWRDDDAIEVTGELDKLLVLSDKLQTPVHLAVIPKPATQALADHLIKRPATCVLVHGWAHTNHAPEGAKKAEFNHPRADALAESKAALTRLDTLFGLQLLPMFVPPWNRVDDTVAGALASQGYRVLSTFTSRPSRCRDGVVQINTHIDPIDWKAGGGLRDEGDLISGIVALLQDRRMGRSDMSEPLGLLTHHLVHDPAIWRATEHCLGVLLDGGAAPLNLLDIKDDLP